MDAAETDAVGTDAAETDVAGTDAAGTGASGTATAARPFLDGIPRQAGAVPAEVARREDEPEGEPAGLEERVPAPRTRPPLPRPWRLLPTPTGTPFTFFYAAVLLGTSLVAAHADPALVHALHQGSSTDVAHLVRTPVLVLFASALWVAGGVGSPYALGFVLVLTALERRVGGWRTAAVFLLGHVLATLATEVPVGFAVLAGRLPDSSLHRLDYGISFGVAASVGALAGLLSPWLRWPILLCFGGMLVDDLFAYADPMTNWGHLMSLAIGVATWPVVRSWRRARQAGPVGPGAGTGRAQAVTTVA
ncbi:rhomboid-like protein [Streptomyces brasiliscabiei]|uniref:rhomboid-like protein n=1 Tax=Streptomyces brasiliscabiei TaxID=2736302 RepID=UPI001F3E3495|nr:rhomboid-like protein [Streptomyces brasiliscabiei]